MSTKNKTSIASQALLEMENIKSAIKEESKNTLKSMLSEAVKNALRESVEEDDDNDYEVVDDEQKDANSDNCDNCDDSGCSEESKTDVSEQGDDEMDTMGQEDGAAMPDTDNGEMTDAENAPMGEETPVEDGEGEDEWSNYSQYQVGDDTYDLTGEEDYDKVVKVFKLLQNDDKVAVKKDGNKLSLQDNETGAEYVIDLGDDVEDESEQGIEGEEPMAEGCIKEGSDDIAGLPSEDEDEFESEEMGDHDEEEAGMMPKKQNNFEGKKSKKAMKENKEIIFEVDLGYTDNYQDKDPIQGLSNNEPSKSGKSWEKGVPTGTKKPWAGQTKSKGQPFEKTVSEETQEEAPVEEATNIGGAVQQRTSSKSHIPDNRKEHGPKAKRHVSAGGDYNEVVEAYKKENKQLKEAVVALRKTINEAYITNVNLGKITKLFVENSVTQNEKLDIINRFSNEAKTVEQSKALYESISKQLQKGPKQVTLEEKSMTVEGSAPINENKIYRSQDLINTLDFMKRMENC